MIKSPKVYFLDTGLLCYFSNIETQAELKNSAQSGFIFEAYVLSELLKNQINKGQIKEVYYFRDEVGLEIDFIIPRKNGCLELIETKFSKTPIPAMAKNLLSLNKNIKDLKTTLALIHDGEQVDNQILVSGVRGYNYKTYLLNN